MLNSFNAVLFDMGNTVLDFHAGKHSDDEKDLIGLANMKEYLDTLKIDKSILQLKDSFLDKWYDDFYIRSEQLIELDVYKYLKEAIANLNTSQYKELIRLFYKPYKDEIVVNEGIEDLFKRIKNKDKKIGIISNCILPEELYIDIFKHLDLDKYIDEYTFSYTYNIRKPNPDLFKIAVEKLSVDVSKLLMVGDGIKPDIYGSNQLGIKSIWYNMKNKKNDVHIENMIGEIKSFNEL